MILKRQTYTLLLAALTLIATSATSHASFISPKRVMIEKGKRTGTITVLNRSKRTMTYEFSWQDRAQLEGGKIVLLTDQTPPEQYRSAKGITQFSPRRVILRPGEKQKIRLLVKRTPNMPEGEYHSHMLVKADPLVNKDTSDPNLEKEMTVSVRTYASLPVFIRSGQTTLDFDVLQSTLGNKDANQIVSVSLQNNSTRSAYLNQKLKCTTSDGQIRERSISTIRLYQEVSTLKKDMVIPKSFNAETCSSLSLLMYGMDDFEYRNKIIKEIQLK